MTTAIRNKEEMLRNPKPGTACAAARDFGIDLTLLIENLRLTPEERVRRHDALRDGINHIKASSRMLAGHQ